MRKRDLCSSIFLFLLSAVYIASSFGYSIWDRYGPGPGFFPLLLGLVLCALSVILFLIRMVKKREPGEALTEAESLKLSDISKSMIYLVAIICFYFLFDRLGSLPTIFLFMMIILYLMNHRSLKLSLSVSILTTVLGYVLFVRMLGVPLPGGIIKNVIRFY